MSRMVLLVEEIERVLAGRALSRTPEKEGAHSRSRELTNWSSDTFAPRDRSA